jgi:DNA-binding transcriptional ArsR family regulator
VLAAKNPRLKELELTMITYPDARKVATVFAAIGEPTRMLILHRLAEKEYHVSELAELLQIPVVNMSHHLGVMRQAGLLEDERSGRKVFYRLHPDVFQLTPNSSNTIGTLKIQNYVVNLTRTATEDGKAKPKLTK